MPKHVDPKKAAALALVTAIHLERVNRKAVLRNEIEEQLRDRLNDVALRESRAANEALALGVSKTAIGRALGTANWESINAILARTAGDVTAEDLYRDPLDERYSFDPDSETLTVTLDAETLAKNAKDLGWTPEQIADRKLDLGRATFTLVTRDDGSHYLDPITELATKENGWKQHPAQRWTTNYKENMAEALAYAVAHNDLED